MEWRPVDKYVVVMRGEREDWVWCVLDYERD